MQFNMTNEQYKEYVKGKSPNSTTTKDCVLAFLIGGLICLIGQFINIFFTNKGFSKETASTLTSITLIFVGAFLTGINVYDDIAKYAGGGTIVPITGFANSMTSSAIESKSEGLIMGIMMNMFKLAGAVIVAGVCSAFISGLLIYIIGGLG